MLDSLSSAREKRFAVKFLPYQKNHVTVVFQLARVDKVIKHVRWACGKGQNKASTSPPPKENAMPSKSAVPPATH